MGDGFKKAYYGGNLKALHTEKGDDYIFTQTQLISCSYLKTIISNLLAPQKDENHTAIKTYARKLAINQIYAISNNISISKHVINTAWSVIP